MRLLPAGILLVLAVPGCLDPASAQPCPVPPQDAVTWPDDHGLGVELSTKVEAGHVLAWACNLSGATRWTTVREGSCAGPWSWVLYAADDGSAYDSGPGGHYGECDIARLEDGEGSTYRVETAQAHPGDRVILRFHVLLQPEQLEDAGGGSVTATIDL